MVRTGACVIKLNFKKASIKTPFYEPARGIRRAVVDLGDLKLGEVATHGVMNTPQT
jgi:hypothetical protein